MERGVSGGGDKLLRVEEEKKYGTELNQKKSKIKVKTKEEKTCSREGEKEESMQRVPSAIKTFDI